MRVRYFSQRYAHGDVTKTYFAEVFAFEELGEFRLCPISILLGDTGVPSV